MKRSDKLRAGKFDVDVDLVRRLLAGQFPQLAHLDVQALDDDGWDNWTFRLGPNLKLRFPTAAGYAGQAAKEFEWLPILAPHLPLQISRPVALGAPGSGYPWHWSLYDWIEGRPVRRNGDLDMLRFAEDLAAFLNALRAIGTTEAPLSGAHSFHRGGDVVRVYGAEARQALATIADRIDIAGALAVLEAAETAVFRDRPTWLHGDIAVGNLLVRDGRLAAVIDFGCCAVGDPACDLVIAWLFLDGESRQRFRDALSLDAACWARARAWALWKAAIVIASGAPTHPDEFSPLEVIETVVREHRGLQP